MQRISRTLAALVAAALATSAPAQEFSTAGAAAGASSVAADAAEGPAASEKPARAAEFYFESVPGEVLIPVQVIGAVGRSGIYDVPRQTDLLRLITLAGGINADADETQVLVRRRSEAKQKVSRYDLDALMEQPSIPVPTLRANDVVMVPAKKPLFSNDVMAGLNVGSTVLAIIVTGLLLSQQAKK